jgi:nitroreductase
MIHTNDPQQVIAFLRGLRAVRQFRAKPLPQEVIDAILEVARWSGSASNNQPWEFVVIRQRETLQALSKVEGYAGHMAGAALGIVLVMAGKADRVDQETYDEGRLSERIMLAAASYGVGSSIGWLRGSGVEQAKAMLGIPTGRLVRTVISLGYPDEDAHRARPKSVQTRKPLAEIVHLERYS